MFNDLFPKPMAQLVAGIGNVTDGLILKIVSEGLFIDDDVRGVAQREWDVKAWTLKLVEVSFSPFCFFFSFPLPSLDFIRLFLSFCLVMCGLPNTDDENRRARKTERTSCARTSATATARSTSSSSISRRAGNWPRGCSV
jgi:hypothetical protein